MEPRPIRIAYAIELFVAAVAFFECWSQVGGQAPLDIMPWWLKLLLVSGFSFFAVRLTAALVAAEKFPSVNVLRWGLAMAALLVIVALTTYYFFLNVPDSDEEDQPTATALTLDR